MRTELETRLKQLPAPDAPTNLKARCLQTVPAEVQRARAKPRGFGRLFSAPKLGLATLVLATAIGLAFWNTRPVANKSASVGGNVAFAQTVEAMKNVNYIRISSWDINGRTDASAPFTRRVANFQIDFSRGIYFETGPMPLVPAHPNGSSGNSIYYRELGLPNDTTYRRDANSKELHISISPERWNSGEMAKKFREAFTNMGASSVFVAGIVPGQKVTLASSHAGTWKGLPVNIFVFQARWPKTGPQYSPEDRAEAMESKVYVDPKTNLATARQTFLLLKDGSRQQLNEIEFDYTRPDASVFDPARLKIGAHIVDERRKK